MNKEQFIAHAKQTSERCLNLLIKKNSDYGAEADPFKNFRGSTLVGVDPKRAILVRMTDKMARVSNLLDKPPEVVNESITDTLDDLINYSIILQALIANDNETL
jgi:hypothetical protein